MGQLRRFRYVRDESANTPQAAQQQTFKIAALGPEGDVAKTRRFAPLFKVQALCEILR